MRLFYSSLRNNNHFWLEGDEFRHSTKVLRQRKGDKIHIIDGSGRIYECLVEDIQKQKLMARIITHQNSPTLPYRLTIAIAPTKNQSRFEWFIEKSIEIGIHKIIPIICARSEKPRLNLERLEKLSISAMKQSKNTYKPIICEPMQFNDFLKSTAEESQKYLAYVEEKTEFLSKKITANPIIVAIGPEGGFTKAEATAALAAGYQPVSLGESRLRTETAGVATCQIVKTTFDFIKK